MEVEDQCLSLDRISTLPANIIEAILCLVPIKDAARTSILSRNWRHNWVTIPKLEFIEKDFKVTTNEDHVSSHMRKQMSTMLRILYAIYQILLVHCGPIQEFILSMLMDITCFEIDQVLHHLSSNHNVKNVKLDLKGCYLNLYKVPLSIFSLHELTDLYLDGCYLNYLGDTFNGFPRLTSLHLVHVKTFRDTILRIIRTSPLLKSITLICDFEHANTDENDFDRDDTDEIDGSMIADLFQCLPVIEDMIIDHSVIEARFDAFPQEIPHSLVHLKSFCFTDMSFSEGYGLAFLVLLMRCSPNLEKISLSIWPYEYDNDYETPSTEYSDIWSI